MALDNSAQSSSKDPPSSSLSLPASSMPSGSGPSPTTSPRSPRDDKLSPRHLAVTPLKTLQRLSPRSKSISSIERESIRAKKSSNSPLSSPPPTPVLLSPVRDDDSAQKKARRTKKGSIIKRLSVSLNPKLVASSEPAFPGIPLHAQSDASFPGVPFHDQSSSSSSSQSFPGVPFHDQSLPFDGQGSFPGVRFHTTSSLPAHSSSSSSPPTASPPSSATRSGSHIHSSVVTSPLRKRADRASRAFSMMFMKKSLLADIDEESRNASSSKKPGKSTRKNRSCSAFTELDVPQNVFPLLSIAPSLGLVMLKDTRLILVPDELLGHDDSFVQQRLDDPSALPKFVLNTGRSYLQLYTDICSILHIDASFFSCQNLAASSSKSSLSSSNNQSSSSSSSSSPAAMPSSSSSTNITSTASSMVPDNSQEDMSASSTLVDLTGAADDAPGTSDASNSSSHSSPVRSPSLTSVPMATSSSHLLHVLGVEPEALRDVQQHYELTVHSARKTLSPYVWLGIESSSLASIFSDLSDDFVIVRRSCTSLALNYLRFLEVVDPSDASQVLDAAQLPSSFCSLKSRMLMLSNLPTLLTRSHSFSSTFFQMGGLSVLLDCLLRDQHAVSPSFHILVLSAMKACMSSSFQNFLRFVSSNENELMYRLLSATFFSVAPSLCLEAFEILVGICQHQSLFKPAVNAARRIARETRKKPWEQLIRHLDVDAGAGGVALVSVCLQLLGQLLLISPNKKQAGLLLEAWFAAGIEPHIAALSKLVAADASEKELPVYLNMFNHTVQLYRPPPAKPKEPSRTGHSKKKSGGAASVDSPQRDDSDGGFARVASATADELNARYEVVSYIAKGAFGRVYKVKERKGEAVWALKEQTKSDIYDHNMVGHCALELEILECTRELCPFLVQFHAAVQTSDKLFIFMEYVPGGSLWDLLRQRHVPFSEDETRFYASEILLGIECLHAHNYVYRDLKLENLLITLDGHIKISDFGLSHRQAAGQRVHSFSGTAHYLAPEVLNDPKGEVGHTRAVDWWAFGIILHILLTLEAPFWSDSYALLFEQIKNRQISFTEPLYQHLSPASISLLVGLLTKDPAKRLGCDGAVQIKQHRFFDAAADIRPPMLPCPIDELPLAPGLHPFHQAAQLDDKAKKTKKTKQTSEVEDEN